MRIVGRITEMAVCLALRRLLPLPLGDARPRSSCKGEECCRSPGSHSSDARDAFIAAGGGAWMAMATMTVMNCALGRGRGEGMQ